MASPGVPLVSVMPPARDPVWSGWDVAVIAVLAVLAIVTLGAIFGLGAYLIYQQRGIKEAAPLVAIMAQALAYVGVGAYMVMMVEGKYRVRFWPAIRWNWPRDRAWMFVALGVMTVALDLVSRYLPMPKTTPFEEFFARPRDAYLMVIFAVSLGPLMEELFFRGFLYPVLTRRMGAVWGIFFTALPFGLMHYIQYRSWAAVLVIFLVGVVLTTVRAVTNSVAASFLVHVGYNGTLMVLTAAATDGFRHMPQAGALLLKF